MPKQVIDYSNTIFYKICCKDEYVKELYIGHTTNFVQRKHGHKCACINEKDANHNLKVYKCIRDNGGWNNWKMEIIGFRKCYDHYEARKVEQSYFESLNATLNSIEPLPKPKPRPVVIAKEKKEKHTWNCDVCGIICQTEKQFLTHQESNKHKRNLNNKKSQKIPKKFSCDFCHYNTSSKKDFNKHLLTLKHNLATKSTEKSQKIPTAYSCDSCGRSYKDRTGLWRHKQKCTDGDNIDYKTLFYQAVDEMKEQRHELVSQLHVQQDEIKNMMGQMIGTIGNTINHTTTNNTSNNQFNINMFLNEQCKDAINLSDFIDRIEISHDDLENNAQLGFVNGMTKILMDNLKLLTIHQRPIHCTDVKRETLYIKDHNVWNKEKSVEKLENAIQEVSRKSLKSLLDWKKINPEYSNMDSEFSKRCIPMQQNSTGICNKGTFYPKIIHNLARENTITQLKV